MVEGTILQQKLELGIGQLMGGEMYVGADDNYDKLLEQHQTRLTSVNVNPPPTLG